MALALGTSFSAFSAPPPKGAGLADYQALPLARTDQGHIVVSAMINGRPARLAIDTGAPISAVSRSRLDYFGLAPVGPGSEFSAQVLVNGGMNNVTIAKTLRLGALTLVEEPFVIVDLDSRSRAGRPFRKPEVDGIIGADILFPTKAVVDCERDLLVMKVNADLPGNVPGFDRRGYQSIPILVTEGNNLFVRATINQRPVRLLVDTGAFTTLLHREFVVALNLPLRKTRYRSSGVNVKESAIQAAYIKRLSVGPVNIEAGHFGVIDLDQFLHHGIGGNPPVAGLLGGETLRRHGGIVDFGTRKLYLKG